jgi:hypothetical protein
MTIKTDKRSQWFDPNLQPNEGPSRDYDQFAPVDFGDGGGLRRFVEQEIQRRNPTFESCSSEVLAPGIYLRRVRDGLELVVYRGRQAYDVFPGNSREALIQLAQDLQEGRKR